MIPQRLKAQPVPRELASSRIKPAWVRTESRQKQERPSFMKRKQDCFTVVKATRALLVMQSVKAAGVVVGFL